MIALSEGLVRSWMPLRPEDGHKGTFGKVSILAGCEGFTGAPCLAAAGALRSGAGLIFLQVPRCVYPIVAVKCTEVMPSPVDDQKGKAALSAYAAVLSRAEGCDAVLLGPGLGRSAQSDELARRLAENCTKPLVLDADGLNAHEGHIDSIRQRTAPTILTPHDGEYRRLMGCCPGEDRVEAALSLARRSNAITVLKGHSTIIAAPDGTVYRNTTGNAGMAKGGSGDVLGGMIVSFLAQGMEPIHAAAAAVWCHGRAGDLCKHRYGERYMTPSDVIEALGDVLRSLEE